MMDKAQGIDSFWNGFGIPAYDENTVPTNAVMPYITYATLYDNLDHPVVLTASIWYRSTSWKDITKKADQIAENVGVGGKTIKLDDGYAYITRGTPFAQRMNDTDDSVRRIYINLITEFLTAV